MFLTDVDLSHPLKDHPFWRDVRGVWLPVGNLAGKIGTGCETLYDLSPYGNHATKATASYQPEWNVTERGLACEFDGTDDELTIPYAPSLDVSMSFSLACVFEVLAFDASDYYPGVLNRYSSGSDNGPYRVGFAGSGSSLYGYSGDGSASDYVLFGSVIANRIIHAVLTSTPTTLQTYIDGLFQNSTVRTVPSIFTGSSSLHLGTYRTGTDAIRHLNCRILSVHLFDRTMSDAEVAFFHDQSLKNYPELIRTYPTKTYIFVGAYQTLITSNRKSIIRI